MAKGPRLRTRGKAVPRRHSCEPLTLGGGSCTIALAVNPAVPLLPLPLLLFPSYFLSSIPVPLFFDFLTIFYLHSTFPFAADVCSFINLFHLFILFFLPLFHPFSSSAILRLYPFRIERAIVAILYSYFLRQSEPDIHLSVTITLAEGVAL